jgi:hypothetical protein
MAGGDHGNQYTGGKVAVVQKVVQAAEPVKQSLEIAAEVARKYGTRQTFGKHLCKKLYK